MQCQETAGLSLREYVEGYKEVYKFLCLMGTVFGWVGSDVYAKYTTLEKYLIGDKKEEYQNIKTMIDFEVLARFTDVFSYWCVSGQKQSGED